jgi:hypothetical protein
MSTEHRRAPRKRITETRRVGSWGSVFYEHVLECGHIEKRPRLHAVKSLACVSCLRNQKKEIEILSLGAPTREVEPYAEQSEIEIARVKAKLAHYLNVSLEQVEVSVVDKFGKQKISGAVVFLSEQDLNKIVQ